MKYVPSAFVGRLSRSAGSTTAGHNRFGAYFRNRTIPTNPVTGPQTTQRANFASLSANYRVLTEAQRDAWTAFGQSWVRTDSLGETYTLTGIQAYIAINRNKFVAGLAPITTPPLYAPPAAPASITIDSDSSGPTLEVAYTPTPLAAGSKLVIMATRPLSAGINFQQRGAYKLITVTAAAAASPANVLAAYTAIYGASPLAGEAVLFKVWILDADGLPSAEIDAKAITI